MERTNQCPKCQGNVFLERDFMDGEWYEYCLQCSHRHYLPPIVKREEVTLSLAGKTRKRRKKRQRRTEKHDE